jgi:hypothetical protein
VVSRRPALVGRCFRRRPGRPPLSGPASPRGAGGDVIADAVRR